MVKLNKDDWELWNEERQRFASRDTTGFTQDLEALKTHILKLQEVCPKDKAGWPTGTALTILNNLKRDYDRFTRYLKQLR